MKNFILLSLCLLAGLAIQAQSWETIFLDDFNRADGPLGPDYTIDKSANMNVAVSSNEASFASSSAPAFWSAKYVEPVDYDSLRVSCMYHCANMGYNFSLDARDNGVNTYSATVVSSSDSVILYSRDYVGGRTVLGGDKAHLNTVSTYYMEFTMLNDKLTVKFVQIGSVDTLSIITTDDALNGTTAGMSGYYANSASVFVDNYKIEAVTNGVGVYTFSDKNLNICPNPANDHVRIDVPVNGNQTLLLSNTSGQVLINTSIYCITGNYMLDTSALEDGIYFIRLQNNYSETYAGKLMIAR